MYSMSYKELHLPLDPSFKDVTPWIVCTEMDQKPAKPEQHDGDITKIA